MWLKAELQKRFAQSVKYLIYGHDHGDHRSGTSLIRIDLGRRRTGVGHAGEEFHERTTIVPYFGWPARRYRLK